MVAFIKKMKNSEFGMRIAEKFFPNARRHPATFSHFKEAIIRFKECTNKKSPSQIKKEVRLCENYWHCYPYHYYIYDLYRADRHLTNEELINYIPHYYWYHLFLGYYDSQKFSVMADNKIVIHHVFNSLNIRMPKVLCILFNGKLFSRDMKEITFDNIYQDLCNASGKLFVKPAEGSGGKGFFIFHKNNQGHYVSSENTIFNENFLHSIGKKV